MKEKIQKIVRDNMPICYIEREIINPVYEFKTVLLSKEEAEMEGCPTVTRRVLVGGEIEAKDTTDYANVEKCFNKISDEILTLLKSTN